MYISFFIMQNNNNNLSNEEPTNNSNPNPPNNFSDEFDTEQNNLNADKFAQKQAHYKQMLENNTPQFDDNPYY